MTDTSGCPGAKKRELPRGEKSSGKPRVIFFRAAVCAAVLFLLRAICVPSLFAQESRESGAPAPAPLPRIENLRHRDLVFRQYSADVQNARRALAQELPPEQTATAITFYSYVAKDDDDLLGLAARCSVPYESIATLNRITNAGESISGRTLILPSMPGLYLPETFSNQFERLLFSSLESSGGTEASVRLNVDGEIFFCVPGARLDGTTRTFFLVRTMRFPLPDGVLTSRFGNRINPVTGNKIFHRGIDLAAPTGTPVLACADGVVVESGYSNIYGNYIILRHSGNRESLYGHLSEKKIKLHDRVKSGSIIGNVGSTGQSTGPHLHFEIHENGIPKNPEGLLR